ncbi:hypothetical protein BH11PSE2_BH11PSE2_11280 [soil metagenome]
MNAKSLLKVSLFATAITFAASPVLAQISSAPPAPPPTPINSKVPYKAPRTIYGTPDFEGTWTNVTVTPLERPASYGTRKALTPEEVAKLEGAAIAKVEYENKPTDPNQGAEDKTNKNCTDAGGRDCGYNAGWKDSTVRVMRVGGEPRTSFIVSTPNGRVPPRAVSTTPVSASQRALDQAERDNLAGEGATGVRRGQNDNPEGRSLSERCIAFGNTAGPLLPNGYYNNNIKIVQTKDNLAIQLEMVHDVRMVRIGQKHRSDGVRPYFGDSIGWWEGDTLVVETTNYHPSTSFRGSSANLKLTEKFTRVAKDRLLYRFTVDDPSVWSAAWTGEYEFYPTGGDLYEYACHEGNYGLEGILSGARAEDEAAKKKTASR